MGSRLSSSKEKEIYVKKLINQKINIKKQANHNGNNLREIEDNLAKWCNIALDEIIRFWP